MNENDLESNNERMGFIPIRLSDGSKVLVYNVSMTDENTLTFDYDADDNIDKELAEREIGDWFIHQLEAASELMDTENEI